MEITRTAHADNLELRLEGRMDATWSNHVAGVLAECVRSGQHQILLDMAAVDYISSAGIRILVLHARQLTNIQGGLKVINASESVRKVLQMTGLGSLLAAQAELATAPARTTTEPLSKLSLAAAGATAEVYELDPGATLRLQWRGDPLEWFEGRWQPETCALAQFPSNTIGIGLGSLVSGEASITQPCGEFLAAGGAAVCQPADGANKPDYLLLEGALTPAVKVVYGVLGEGNFRQLLRFDKGPEQTSVPLSAVVKACLEASSSDVVGLVIIAETASLIGASLQKTATFASSGGQMPRSFSFPEVRDWLSFTSEPAFADSTCLIVGFAAGKASGPGLRLLKPMVPSCELYGHFHAVALPYHPLRKGKVDLAETLRPLFETEQLLGLLHLLNDWRELNGIGESRLLRGACWCSPATL